MRQYVDLLSKIICDSPSSCFEEERRFRTSLNIIGEVMNVPMCALSSILRANGYDEVDPASICIDEEMLTYFADAYIRKMKNYFLSSVRNIEDLTYQEFTDLNEFYNTFKKQEVKFTRRAEWSQIDTGLLRAAFMDKIEELTPSRKSSFEIFSEFIAEELGHSFPLNDIEITWHKIVPSELSPEKRILNGIINSRVHDNLWSITHCRFYLTKKKPQKVCQCPFNITQLFYIAARYHIFVTDDKDSDGKNQKIERKSSLLTNLISNKYGYKATFMRYRFLQSTRRRQVGSQASSEAKTLR